MSSQARPPRLTPVGKPQEPRRTGGESDSNAVDEVKDTEVIGGAGKGGYANTDEATPDDDGLVPRRGDRDRPLV
jgi:hypothetical protein